ncbi:hypothetical protein [Amycolatopsis rubida]|uniref:Uncharacterized protein n=1 Tax=Amycolatopsis rubida TaxID=112413 RepID=A0A1I5LAW7_9PSEU|nr:hypothetical protein [Amycolatopsis rubida]SFO94397.1 hypothetical protein SAMN05421854_103518 [Amycolatopsis rubida]
MERGLPVRRPGTVSTQTGPIANPKRDRTPIARLAVRNQRGRGLTSGMAGIPSNAGSAAGSAGPGNDVGPAGRNATEAVEQLRPVLLAVCSQAAADPAGYTRHFQLVEQHPELRARDAVKMQQFADKLGDLLIDRGSDEATARFAAQIAIACYQAVKRLGNDPRTLVEEIRAAFGRVLALGTGATEPQAG